MIVDSEKYDDNHIIALATQALESSDPATSEAVYNQIVVQVQKTFNNNQRDVAAELQRLSKIIEASRNADDSNTFKQRTCESMLKISMAERHKGKAAPVLQPAKAPPLFQNLEYLSVGTSAFEHDARFYLNTLKAELLWAFRRSESNFAAFKVVYGPPLLLTDQLSAPNIQPMFSVSDLDAAIQALKKNGLESGERFNTPVGQCCTFKDPSGNSYRLLQKSPAESLEREYQDKNSKDAIRFD